MATNETLGLMPSVRKLRLEVLNYIEVSLKSTLSTQCAVSIINALIKVKINQTQGLKLAI